jgi:uncharacterized membrane protein
MSKWKEAATQSWRTTVSGTIAAIGLGLLCLRLLPDWGWVPSNGIKQVGTWGLILTVAGVILLAVHARDHHAK